MALGITYRDREGILYMAGCIDESTDLQPILGSQMPILRLNLRDVTHVNSLGLRRFIDMMRTLADRPLEFHECSSVIVEAINTVPLFVGGQKRIGRIKSACAPMTCEDGHKATVVTQIQDLKVSQKTITLPRLVCTTCHGVLKLENGMEADDFFFFLIAS